MANEELRKIIKNNGLTLWQIAEFIGISEPTMTRKFRHELTPAQKKEIMNAIKSLKGDK